MYSNGGPRQAPDNWLQPHSHSRARVSDPYVTGLMGWTRSLLVGCAFWDFLDTSATYHPDDTVGELTEPHVDPATSGTLCADTAAERSCRRQRRRWGQMDGATAFQLRASAVRAG